MNEDETQADRNRQKKRLQNKKNLMLSNTFQFKE